MITTGHMAGIAAGNTLESRQDVGWNRAKITHDLDWKHAGIAAGNMAGIAARNTLKSRQDVGWNHARITLKSRLETCTTAAVCRNYALRPGFTVAPER